ncbi:MAG: ThiF family adenylyltransferase [Caldilineaceae bacterium]|jgi:molybdopterin/thiamine biosynthesis adenylyltransferase
MPNAFDYEEAFSRNIGWLTEAELRQLRGKRVAIAGLGGVGGAHLLALTRLGVGAFNIADLDAFEVANFNRQFGAMMSQIGRPKVDVMAEMALDINPELDITKFRSGIDSANVNEFLRDVDLYIDGLDFFVTDAREAVFSVCAERNIAAITAAPLGWGVAMLAFLPGGMTFEDYFQFQGQDQLEKLRRFLVGLSPTRLQFSSLVDASRLDIENQRGPSTAVGVYLCAGFVAGNAVKILLQRGEVPSAPTSLQLDVFSNAFDVVELPGGVQHPEAQACLAALRMA